MKLKNKVLIKSENFTSAKNLVVFLHGYGSEGSDFKLAAEYLSRCIDDAIFFAPDAPFECPAYNGRQWFPLSDENLSEDLANGSKLAAPILMEYIEDTKKEYNCDTVNLLGFSQGAALSLAMIYYSDISRIIAFSGLFSVQENKKPVSMETKILIVHGDKDDVVPYSHALFAKKSLDKLELDPKLITCPGVGHTISMDVWDDCIDFLNT